MCRYTVGTRRRCEVWLMTGTAGFQAVTGRPNINNAWLGLGSSETRVREGSEHATLGAAVPATSTSQTHVEEFSGQKSDRVFLVAFSESQACRFHAAYPSTLHSAWSRQRSGI